MNEDEMKYLDKGIENLTNLIRDLESQDKYTFCVYSKDNVMKELHFILYNFVHVKNPKKENLRHHDLLK